MKIWKTARQRCTRYMVCTPPPAGADPARLPPREPPQDRLPAEDAAAAWLAHLQAGRIEVR